MAQRAGGIAVLLDSGEVRRRLARSETPCLGALHVLKLGPKGLLPGTAATKAQACRMLCVVVNKAQGHQLELIELKVPQSRSSFRKGQSWGQYLQTVWGDTDGPLVPKKMGEGDPAKLYELDGVEYDAKGVRELIAQRCARFLRLAQQDIDAGARSAAHDERVGRMQCRREAARKRLLQSRPDALLG